MTSKKIRDRKLPKKDPESAGANYSRSPLNTDLRRWIPGPGPLRSCDFQFG